MPELPLAAVETGAFPDGSEQIIAANASDFSETVLYRVSATSVERGTSVPGFFISGASR